MRRLLIALTLFAMNGFATAQDMTPVDFQRDIRPILSNHCFKCHGPALQESGARLDTREGALKRKIVVPGQADKSLMLKRILADEDERMPPADAGERLKPAQIELLKRWIAQGAEYSPHWAFIKPKQAAAPKVKDGKWVRNPIDAFVLARLEKEGIAPSPEADRATLIRRVSLDLLGLLPTPKEVDGFVNDPAPDAYEKLIDRLLASPHYGERQARHWLDLARYADSNGYTIDGKRSIWPWRDWVINAFNKDMPFDQFTLEQIAGDMLPNATHEQVVATGFHRNTSFNEEGGTNPEQFRVERTVDRTNTTGSVWLGLTVGCAQCHTHKYDPITHKEYYQLYAFLNSMDEPKVSMPTPEQAAKLKDLNAQLAKVKKQPIPKKKSPEELAKLLDDLEMETNGGWRVIYPKTVVADQGAKLDVLEDRSVLASGKIGTAETYTIHGVAPETGTITAVRLEALTHESLPKKGPGLSSGGNFVLNQFVFETDGVPHKFKSALADYSQKDYTVETVASGNLAKGWGISGGVGRDHQALFYLDKPHPVREGQAFVFTMRHNPKHAGYAVGRFRIAVTFASDRFLALPLEAQNVVLIDKSKRTPKEMELAVQSLLKAPPLSARAVMLQKEIKSLEGQIESTLVLREAKTPRVTKIQLRGDFLTLGDEVQPGVFAALNPLNVKGTANRLDFAKWLVSPDNPLTARVYINRMWQQYFGKGIVETENDFGIQGALPTHPELLDWLAVEFMGEAATRSGAHDGDPRAPLRVAASPWSIKRMHKLIVTSATYRQSSKARPDLREKDPQNKLLARQHRLRLDAEIIRDAALSASGLLTPKIGGPGVYPPQAPEIFAFTQNNHPWPESKGPDRYRRGMYTFIWRQSQHPLLTTFDAPDAQTACTKRNRSNTPLQALHLANDPVFVEIAKGLAGRVVKEGPVDDAGKITYAFKLSYARVPTKLEQDRLLSYLQQQREANADRAWTMVARVLLNLDEFVTRE
jgi:hypothetical protein